MNDAERDRPLLADDDPRIALLIRLAGERSVPPAAAFHRARAAVAAEWQATVRRRRIRRAAVVVGAVAASLVAALTVQRLAGPGAAVATPYAGRVVRIAGTVTVEDAAGTRALRAGDEVRSGATVTTGKGAALAMALAGRTFLHVDRHSRLRLDGPGAARLDAGRLYVDAGARGDHVSPAIAVDTRFGVVRDIGTQFDVAVGDEALLVRVRDGAVTIHRNEMLAARAGAREAVRVRADGRVTTTPLAVGSDEWAWIRSDAAAFALEGARLADFLDWVARQEGRRWRFADEATARTAASVVLHGSVEGLTAEEALGAVLETCGMTYRLAGGEIRVVLAK